MEKIHENLRHVFRVIKDKSSTVDDNSRDIKEITQVFSDDFVSAVKSIHIVKSDGGQS